MKNTETNIKAMNNKAAVFGGGVIGGGWAARFLLMGWDVNVYDPDPNAERKLTEVLNNARHALPSLYEHRLPKEGKLTLSSSVEEAVKDVVWISECVPERLELKQSVYAQIQQFCSDDTMIASSTSGFRPSQLQEGSSKPDQIFVAHPFNPVYLVPLIELVGDSSSIPAAKELLSGLGMFPLVVRKEIDAHIADRFLEAVWREALWLVNDGIATTQEIDDSIMYGFGLRWAQMGLFETYRVAGGEAGMKHFLAQFGPALKWPWTKLMDVPDLTDELIQKIADQSDEQSGQYTIRELERIRDNNLTSIFRGLKTQNWGAGKLLNEMDKGLSQTRIDQIDISNEELITSVEREIPIDWTDYNKHMNESRYGQVYSDAADFVMRLVGADVDYIAAGLSYFTVDTHVKFIDECHAGDAIYVTSQVLIGEGKKLKLFHRMYHKDGRLLSTGEQFLVHVDLNTRHSSMPREDVAKKISALTKAHQSFDQP